MTSRSLQVQVVQHDDRQFGHALERGIVCQESIATGSEGDGDLKGVGQGKVVTCAQFGVSGGFSFE